MPSTYLSVVLAILLAICGVIESQVSSTTISFNSTHPLHAETFGVQYPTNSSLLEPSTFVTSISFNVSQATFMDTRSIFVIRDEEVYNATDKYTNAAPDVITGTYGTIVPPCFPANRSESFFFLSQSNATTDGVAGEATYSFGEVPLPTLTNGSAFEVKCRVPYVNKCNDYYSLTISSVPVSQYWVLTVESTKNITLHFFVKHNNTKCESTPYFITEEKPEAVGLPAIDTPIDFWLGIEATDPSLTSQVKMTWKLYATDSPSGDNTPSEHNSPNDNNTPHGTLVGELPRWAVALMIVFIAGIVVLIIVVIALCIKRRKRVNYSTI
jgi:hypothetical protein